MSWQPAGRKASQWGIDTVIKYDVPEHLLIYYNIYYNNEPEQCVLMVEPAVMIYIIIYIIMNQSSVY